MEHLECREAESEMEEDEPGTSTLQAGKESHGYQDVTMEEPEVDPEEDARTRQWIQRADFRELGDLDRYDGRSCLRAS